LGFSAFGDGLLSREQAQFLVPGYLPDDFDPSSVTEAMGRAIHALNKEMEAAGVMNSLAA
jgi:hypothetical protein